MPKFRKKPVEIEAVQFSNKITRMDNKKEMLELFGDFDGWRVEEKKGWEVFMVIDTLEGEMVAKEGDWIIKGIKGEFYPCKPDIFEATYEPVE